MVLVLMTTMLSVHGGFTSKQANVAYAAAAWSSTTVYTGGEEVEYNGATYKAKWWTQGDAPDKGGPWELVSGGSGGTGGDSENPG